MPLLSSITIYSTTLQTWFIKFYQEPSFISRPDEDGVMITVTTMKGINEKICSLDYTAYKAEIKTADTQESYNKDGVIVLVTGCLIKKVDNQRKKFIQSFFLAPQDKGYFVFNDVFRYVDEIKSLDDNNDNNNHLVVVEGIDDNQTLPLIQDLVHLTTICKSKIGLNLTKSTKTKCKLTNNLE
ncbi:unnamed protein product [Lactuca virosa]|uniref:NTF2 domain-containing protein n=1 Tax=Lactuca virosa TaxID=75947 RepID=A0AAU9LJ92_9ASTR|nr:unnamed protein product [Lactuca virosa]